MNTREIYLKQYALSELPCEVITYVTSQQESNVLIMSFSRISICYDDGEEFNIAKMKDVESQEGFMFWIHDDEYKELVDNIIKSISESFKSLLDDNDFDED